MGNLVKKYGYLLMLITSIFVLAGCGKSAKSAEINGASDLPGKRIGVQIGTTGEIYCSDEYEGDKKGTKIERYNKGADAISSLKNGKIDCVIIDEQPAKAFVDKNKELKILDEEFVEEDYAICVSKTQPQLTESLNTALEELKADGTLDAIKTYYLKGEGTRYEAQKGLSHKNGNLIVATNAQFAPYEYHDNGEIIGIDMDMAQALADKLDKKLKILDIEFDSIITAVQGGKADIGIAGMTVTKDRLKNIDFTNSYTTSRQVIIVNTGEGKHSLSIQESFKQSFVDDNRYEYILKGLGNTILISLLAVCIGIFLGFIVAVIRATHDMTGNLKLLNFLCRIYLTIIRGTPTMVQLLIIYFVIFASVDISKIFVAVLAFGLNSGAYVAEIIRGGIMSLDYGQFEGARSLGLTHTQTMCYVILPQTFKNTLPALANEFIVLIKETSISGYIGLLDLTRGGDIIRGTTYQAFFPLIAVACIYLLLVVGLSALVSKLERSLKKNER